MTAICALICCTFCGSFQ